MRLSFNIELPDQDIRVGIANLSDRSLVGAEDRQSKRFYPLVLCLETLCKINEWYLGRKSFESRASGLSLRVPPLYSSGVYYEQEPPGEEEWLDIPHLYKQGFGDCEDLACARVAEWRHHRNVAAVPCIKSKRFDTPSGKVLTLVHVMCLLPDGTIEDPSRALGMRGDY